MALLDVADQGYFEDVSPTDQDCQTVLFSAVAKGNVEAVETLLSHGANVNATDQDGQTALFYAVVKGKVEVVEALLDRGGDANATDQDGWTALFSAAQEGNVEVVQALLSHGGNVNTTDQAGRSTLIYAAHQGNVDVVEALLTLGGDVNASDQAGRTALIYAADQGNVKVVEALLRHGANVNATDQDGMTALFPAAGKGTGEVVEVLLKKGGDINATDKGGCTALFYAADQRSVAVVEALLGHGAKVNATDQDGRTALFRAAYQGNVEVVEALLKKGGNVNATDKQGMTALFVAAYEIDVEVVEALLSHGANVKATDQAGKTALFYAGSVDVVEALLSHAGIVDIRDQSGKTALFAAVMSGKSEVVDILLERDADASAVDKSGKSAIFYTVNLLRKEVPNDAVVESIKLLMNKGGSPNTKTPAGENLLLYFFTFAREIKGEMDESSVQSLFMACQFLIDCKSGVDLKNLNGQSVIHLVLLLLKEILQQDLESNDLMLKQQMAQKSLKFICSIPSRCLEGLAGLRDGTDGNTPLHLWSSTRQLQQPTEQNSSDGVSNSDNTAYATESPLDKIAMHLLSHGARINIPNNKGETPLHVAQTWNAAKLLLDKGALPNARDLQGNTPVLSRVKKIVDHHLKSAPHLPLCEMYDKTNADTLKKHWEEIFRYGLDPWMKNNERRTLLGSLLQTDAYHLIQALLEVTKTPSTQKYPLDDNGDTPLHTICRDTGEANFWKLNLIDDLLKPEASIVNRTDRKGQTALHIVCQSESYSRLTCEVVQRLLKYSARVDVPDDEGKTCTDIAADKPALMALLTQDINILEIKPWLTWSPTSERHKNLLAEVVRGQNSRQLAGFLHYHVQTPIGKGAFGFVYAGVNSKDGREVAVKQIMKVRLSRREEHREIKNLVGLHDSEHVVQYLNYHVDQDFHYIVLELMEGNLTELMDRNLQFKKEEEVSLCRDMLNGLKSVHQKGMKHRDIKPGNILYKCIPKLGLKLADFGLSSQITSNDTTVMHSKAGTRCWMAPELLKGTAQHCEDTDMYAIGLVLHYLLSGKKHPFGPEIEAGKSDLVIKHETEDNILNYRLLINDGLSHEARDLVEHFLDSNKAKRPSASEALRHPFFWSNQKKINFLMEVGNQSEIGQSRLAAYKTRPLSSVEQDLENAFAPQLATKCWDSEIPQVHREMTSSTKSRKYDTNSAVDLLRMFRNTYSHLPELTQMTKESILEKKVFFDKYPNLLIEVYKAVISSSWDKREEIAAVMEDV